MLIVIARFQSINEGGFETASLFGIVGRVRDEIEVSGTMTSGVERVCCAASVSGPEVVAFADSQEVFVAIGLDVDARSCPKCFACLDEARKTLKREGKRHDV